MDPKNYLEMHLHGEHRHPTHLAKINKLKKKSKHDVQNLKTICKGNKSQQDEKN
jgi:hypothetical protein